MIVGPIKTATSCLLQSAIWPSKEGPSIAATNKALLPETEQTDIPDTSEVAVYRVLFVFYFIINDCLRVLQDDLQNADDSLLGFPLER